MNHRAILNQSMAITRMQSYRGILASGSTAVRQTNKELYMIQGGQVLCAEIIA